MAVYLVTYDLNNETNRPNIVGAIKKFGVWAKLSESSYAVKSSSTVGTIFKKLKPLTDSDDQIYIINLSNPYTGYGPEAVNKWLDENLP